MTALHHFRRLSTAAALSLICAAAAHAAPIYSNGRVVDGAGLSILPPAAGTLGWGAQTASNNSVADDFTVPLGSTWTVESLSLFSYQTGASGFTFTSVNWQIMAGDVNTGTLVASGSATATHEGQVGFRVLSTAPQVTNRPIFQLGVDISDLELNAGSYWLTWNIGGTRGSGPWVVPTLDGNPGNGKQSIAGGSFGAVVDGGTQVNPELAFALNGRTGGTVPEPTSLALVLAAGLAAGWSRKAAAGRRSA